MLRWQLEVTFHEARAHLGVETQRQWSDLAIARTTPALLGLVSVVTLAAHQWLGHESLAPQPAAWYAKLLPTIADTLALVCERLWPDSIIATSPSNPDTVRIPRALLERFTTTLALAA